MRMSLTAGSVVALTYNIKDAAERLGVSKWWLQKFLRQHPVDKAGVPFYVPIGNRKRFTELDLERILEMNRNTEKDRLLSAPLLIWVGLLNTKRMKDLEISPTVS